MLFQGWTALLPRGSFNVGLKFPVDFSRSRLFHCFTVATYSSSPYWMPCNRISTKDVFLRVHQLSTSRMSNLNSLRIFFILATHSMLWSRVNRSLPRRASAFLNLRSVDSYRLFIGDTQWVLDNRTFCGTSTIASSTLHITTHRHQQFAYSFSTCSCAHYDNYLPLSLAPALVSSSAIPGLFL